MDLSKITEEELNERLDQLAKSQQFQYLCEKARREIDRLHFSLESASDIGEIKRIQGKINMFRWVLRNFDGITTL